MLNQVRYVDFPSIVIMVIFVGASAIALFV